MKNGVKQMLHIANKQIKYLQYHINWFNNAHIHTFMYINNPGLTWRSKSLSSTGSGQ